MGYYSGVKEGLDTLSQNAQRKAQTNLTNSETDTQDQETQLKQTQVAKAKYDLQQQQSNDDDQDRAKAILQKAMDATSYDEKGQIVQDTNSTIANTLMNAGKQILGTDPKTGLELIKQSNAASNTAALSQYHTAEAKKYQLGMANDLYAQTAPDGSDWANTQDRLSEVGVVVPDQFKTWSPETAAWVNRRAVQSTAAIKVLNANQKVVANDIKQQQVDVNQFKADTQAKAQQAKEAKTQAGYKPLAGKPLDSTLTELNTDDNFSGLNAGVKLQATQDYSNQIQQNITAGMPAEIARATARNTILGRIKNNTFGSNTYIGAQPTNTQQTIAPINGAPKVGTIVKGWTFLGGDPSNPSAWKK